MRPKRFSPAALGAALVCGWVAPAAADDMSMSGMDMVQHHTTMAMENPKTPLKICPTAGRLSRKTKSLLSRPFDGEAGFTTLAATPLWGNVISHLWVNLDKASPCFGMSDTSYWTPVVSKIPSDIAAIQETSDGTAALVYLSGLPDYLIQTPGHFISFKPGNIYGIYRIAAVPTPNTDAVHDLSAGGTVGILVNGVSVFNYTDTFSYDNTYAWAYDANVAESLIVNADISHATPSDLPQFPKSRGIFHNHQMSRNLMRELHDPFALGQLAPSKLLGFAIDSTPIYGPLGYTSQDASSGLRVLKSSYVQRAWMAAARQGTGHRSSLPGWAVNNWDGSNESGATLLNLFKKPKADMLYKDTATSGAVTYSGDDAKLAAEIKLLNAHKTLQRDKLGYVYWESKATKPNGETVMVRNYLLKSSKLWGPDFDSSILPASYPMADKDIFYFKAKLGTFAEDYDFITGYGDLDFYNGIDSFIPERKGSLYHYVAGYDAKLSDKDRLDKAQFPYIVGVQYKNTVDPFNGSAADALKAKYFADTGSAPKTIYDLGTVGKSSDGKIEQGSVISTWQKMLTTN